MSLKENLTIKKEKKTDRIFCHEDYAADAYKLYCGQKNSFFFKKDLERGELVKITGIASISEYKIYFEVNNAINILIDLSKEKRFLELHNVNAKTFVAWLSTKNGKKEFIDSEYQILITQSSPNLKASLIAGYGEKIKLEFKEQIKNPTMAFEAKVIGKNQGGFIVDVCGVNAFLPGGLAAANKIVNFDEYEGKSIKVMVEDYLSDIQTYIMSHKKYLDHVLPTLINDYDWTIIHEGEVTGYNKYGIFLEFYGMFTGLLHTSKMSPVIKKKFDNRQIKVAQKLSVWVKEVNNKNRLVLTNIEPGTEVNVEIGTIMTGKVTGIKEYGVFIKLKSGESGLISKRDVSREFIMNEIIDVKIIDIKEDKLFFIEFIEHIKK